MFNTCLQIFRGFAAPEEQKNEMLAKLICNRYFMEPQSGEMFVEKRI
jgi:hypothetical protein